MDFLQENASFCKQVSKAASYSENSYWIGLNLSPDGFRWSDNTPIDYDLWTTGEPNNALQMESCAGMYTENGQSCIHVFIMQILKLWTLATDVVSVLLRCEWRTCNESVNKIILLLLFVMP